MKNKQKYDLRVVCTFQLALVLLALLKLQVWQVAHLSHNVSLLEPGVNNWHRHDPWPTMHCLFSVLFLFVFTAKPRTVRLQCTSQLCRKAAKQVLIFLTWVSALCLSEQVNVLQDWRYLFI